MSQTRQLAAIMFTDIVGYTALMGENEQQAWELLKKNRSIQKPLIAKFHGKWLKEIGDGVLASFKSVSDAVYCAAAIQKKCVQHPDLNLRIGIHLGEVVFDDNDVFGDGVNIAARLEPMAPPGEILVSGSVYKNLLNKPEIQTSYIGEEQLKNVREPVKIYRVSVENIESGEIDITSNVASVEESQLHFLPKFAYASVAIVLIGLISYLLYSNFKVQPTQIEPPAVELDKSVVVLPFADMSASQDQGHFSDGIMDEIINHLVKIRDMKVISRTTAMNYKQSSKSAKEIAAELGVATVLEGSVKKEGDQVRITVQLIEGTSDTHLFSESYDRQLTSIFQVQSEVAQLVAKALEAQISPEVRLRIEQIPTHNTRAYELYLKGQEQISLFWKTFDASFINKGVEYYKQSITLDPEFSNAYAGLGKAYWHLTHFSPDYDPLQWELSKENLYKAIELDPGNGWAYAELAVVQHNWDWDQKAAYRSFQKALELSPADPQIHNHLRVFYGRIKDCDGIEKESRIIASLRNVDYKPELDIDLLICRGDLAAISRLNPDNYWIEALLFQGKYEQAIKQLKDSTVINTNPFQLTQLGEAYALAGDTLNAIKVIEQLAEMSKTQYVQNCFIAPIHMALGEDKKAFQLLETGLKEREHTIHVLTRFYYSMFKMQDDPRFRSLMERSWVTKL